MNKLIESLNNWDIEKQEIQQSPSISFFSLSYNEKWSFNDDLISKKSSSNITKAILSIFNNKDWTLSEIFEQKHERFLEEDNILVVKWLDNIEFVFTKNKLQENIWIYMIEISVKNIERNLTKKQKHYLKSIFYNLKQFWFSTKYIDDDFSELNQKDYIIWHKCNAWDVCNLITNLKDNFEEDNERIKKLLKQLKDFDNVNLWDKTIIIEKWYELHIDPNSKKNRGTNQIEIFTKIKQEIVSLELKNIITFKLALENIIINRNNLIEGNSKKIDELILKEWLKNSFLVWNETEDNKIDELITKSTDSVLTWSFEILKKLVSDFNELIVYLEILEQKYNSWIEISESVLLLDNFVKKSDSLFFDAQKSARKNWILSIINPKNWFLNDTLKSKENIEKKQQTKQEEVDEAFYVLIELLSDMKNAELTKDSEKKKLNFEKLHKKNDLLKQEYPHNHIIQNIETRAYFWKIKFSIYHEEFNDIRSVITFNEIDKLKRFSSKYNWENWMWWTMIDPDFIQTTQPNELFVDNYSEIEEIFNNYEYFLKLLYFKNYAFKHSKYTENYQKFLYKKWEFYFDEDVNFEDFIKDFFKKVSINFNSSSNKIHNKILNKKYKQNKFEIIEKNEKFSKDLSEFNNLFDIKIWENIFPIYIINPVWDEKNKIITIWATLENNNFILSELIRFSYTVNLVNLQSVTKNNVEKILVMNFDKTDLESSKVLNKFIIEHLIYWKKPDVIETDKKTYIKQEYHKITKEKNSQYEEYILFINKYNI